MRNLLGIYEKALTPGSWESKFQLAAELGFDFIELSIDESDARLARLNWNDKQITDINKISQATGVKLRSICLSGHRRYPLGSEDPVIQKKALELLHQAIKLADRLNIRIIQLAGYDVFYTKKTAETRANFIKNLHRGLQWAHNYGVMLAIETMDDPFINTIANYHLITKNIRSPWLSVYPDLGNLSAWHNDANAVCTELQENIHDITALHVKDTLPVTAAQAGKFKNVDFGKGCVDFAKLFKQLHDLDYQGSFMIEAWFEDFDHPVERLKAALAFVKKAMRKGGFDC